VKILKNIENFENVENFWKMLEMLQKMEIEDPGIAEVDPQGCPVIVKSIPCKPEDIILFQQKCLEYPTIT
jgi:hypothetical protein